MKTRKKGKKRPHRNSQPERHSPHPILPYLPFAAAAVVIAFVLASFKSVDEPRINRNTTTATTTIETSDGVSLAVDVTYPAGADPVPAGILIHDFAADRRQWDPYVEKFTAAGLAVVQYDMRGFGESRLPRVDGDRSAYLNSLVDDVPAVLEYIRNQPRLTGQLIHVVGLGLGANIAYVASGSGYGIARTVLIGPNAENGLPDGAAIEDFAPTDVLAVTNESAQGSTDALMARVADPKQVVVAPESSTSGMLEDPAVIAEALAWLSNR